MSDPSGIERLCPQCSGPAPGRFCSSCGHAVDDAGAGRRSPRSSTMYSVLGLTAVVVLVGTIAFFAGRTAGTSRSASSVTSLANTPLGGGVSAVPIRAPDISQLSPVERAERLFRRVMLLSAQNKPDSVLFFAPMALDAYEMIGTLDADQRKSVERITAVLNEAARTTGPAR